MQFKRVNKFYNTSQGRRWILRDQSIAFLKGRNVGILGRNGAGKSTLLRLMCGMELPTTGKVRRFVRISWPLGSGGGGGAVGKMTGVESSRFIARLYGADINEMADFVRSFADLGPAIDVPVSTYSSGMRSRLSFAISMALQFRCYLMDELTAVGDGQFREKCIATLNARRAQADVIIVSHQGKTIRRIVDNIVVLQDGYMRFFEDVDEGFDYYHSLS